MHFDVPYPFAGILLSLLLSAAFSYLLYKNNPLGFSKVWFNRAIMALRFVLLFIICFLLLKPMMKWISRNTEKPILVIAVDNSESVAMAQPGANSIPEQLQRFRQRMQDKFTIETYTFGAATRKSDSITFHEKFTNISDALHTIEEDHYHLNHAATILISDGIYNRGSNPTFAADKLKPVYTLALGDTVQHKDVLISHVRFNNKVLLGNEFDVSPAIKAFEANGETLQLTLSENNNVLQQATVNVNTQHFFGSQRFTISKASEGLHTYQLAIKAVKGESNLRNNTIQIQVQVIGNKQKIVLLYQSPHPDVAALTRSLETQPNIELHSFMLSEYKDEYVSDASMFILHQVPGMRGEGARLAQKLLQNKMPLWFIVGKQSGLNFIQSSGIVKINGSNQNYNEAQAWYNEAFSLYQTDPAERDFYQQLSPLFTPYGNYSLIAGTDVLLYQQIGYVKTNYPLLCYGQKDGANQAWLMGEGIWRWRLQDYMQHQQTHFTDSWIEKTIQWVAGKSDRSKFRVSPDKTMYDETEPIRFEAELFNDLYEKINNPDISLTLNRADKKYQYLFNKTDNAYDLPLGTLGAGVYQWEARVNGKEGWGIKKGTIHIKSLQTEARETRADHSLLQSLSNESKGRFYNSLAWDELALSLENNEAMKPVIFETEELKDLLNQHWIFFILIALLGTEWFIRKWNGYI